MKLSILVPVYNEQDRVERALKEALAVPYPLPVEVVVVNDGSTDQTAARLDSIDDLRVVTVHQPRNLGKGAAIRTAVQHASGTHLVILDADLEYDPVNILDLLRPVLAGQSQVVFGNRHFNAHTAYSFWYVMGNKLVTLTANILFNAYIGDLETGFKLLPVELYRSLDIRSHGFGMEAELTGKLLRNRIRPYDVPISYHARSRDEGKKITWRDGVAALGILLRERLRRRQPDLNKLVAWQPADSLNSAAKGSGRPVPGSCTEEQLVDIPAIPGGPPSRDR